MGVFVGEGVLVAWGKVMNGAYIWESWDGYESEEGVFSLSGVGMTDPAVRVTSIGYGGKSIFVAGGFIG